MKRRACMACLIGALVSVAMLFGCSSGAASAGASAAASSQATLSATAGAVSGQSGASADAESAASAEAELSASTEAEPAAAALDGLADGEYLVPVTTDSTMFHLNETSEGMGTLTVENGVPSVHITLVSKKIGNLYLGKASQAKEDEAGWLQPTNDTVTYSDGVTEEVYGFDIPVPVLDEPFDVAILGSKGKWYDHTVTVSSPVSK